MNPISCDLWLLEPNALRQFVQTASLGVAVDAEMVRRSSESRREKSVAILPVHGVLEARPSFLGQFLGMSSYEAIGYQFDRLVSDDSVKGIILDVFSPGGMAYGAPELADKIFSARGTKPILAVANPMAASGAYWIASAADRLVMTPSGDVGSVGVIYEHLDFSKADEQKGVKVNVIRSGGSPYKAELSGNEPLTDEARDYVQSRADAIYAQFVGDLARFRGVTTQHVKDSFGKGRVVGAKQAMAAGMVDRVDTLLGIAIKLSAGRVRIATARAEDEWDAPSDRTRRLERAAALKALAEN